MNCPHCQQQLPDVSDAFCPHCREPLPPRDEAPVVDDPPESPPWPGWMTIVVFAGVPATLLISLLAVPLIVLGLFGVACIRSAAVDRRRGWFLGFFLGLLMFLAGFGGLVGLALERWI